MYLQIQCIHFCENVYKIGYSQEQKDHEHDFETGHVELSTVMYTYIWTQKKHNYLNKV